MALWLCKQEPSCYSLGDLEREGRTIWDGVNNPLAKKHLRQMKPGDRVLFYHTGKEKAIVGEMRVVGEPIVEDPARPGSAVSVPMEFVRRWPRPVTLEEIKSDPLFADWDLIRMSRLSVVAVSSAQWKRLEQISKQKND